MEWLIINAYGDLVAWFKTRKEADDYLYEVDDSDTRGYQLKRACE